MYNIPISAMLLTNFIQMILPKYTLDNIVDKARK